MVVEAKIVVRGRKRRIRANGLGEEKSSIFSVVQRSRHVVDAPYKRIQRQAAHSERVAGASQPKCIFNLVGFETSEKGGLKSKYPGC
jgi:hypothetical protein